MKMITRKIFLPLILVASSLGFLGCGGDSGNEAAVPVSSITITGNDRMRFDPAEFYVQAGGEITLILRNVGSMPKETMGHNLVILQKDVNASAFSAASTRHPRTAYIAPEYAERVVAATGILGPGEEETLVFTAPESEGTYPFVCSFPGHTEVGMKGVMHVIKR